MYQLADTLDNKCYLQVYFFYNCRFDYEIMIFTCKDLVTVEMQMQTQVHSQWGCK